jgi:hypothetical protein
MVYLFTILYLYSLFDSVFSVIGDTGIMYPFQKQWSAISLVEFYTPRLTVSSSHRVNLFNVYATDISTDISTFTYAYASASYKSSFADFCQSMAQAYALTRAPVNSFINFSTSVYSPPRKLLEMNFVSPIVHWTASGSCWTSYENEQNKYLMHQKKPTLEIPHH